MSLKISLVVISKNEARSLRKMLTSVVDIVDEVILVDSGSTDETLAIANEFSARVYLQEWLGFGPQKRYAVAQARNDWVLCLDGDEVLSPLLHEILQSLTPANNVSGFNLVRCNKFLGRYLRHGAGYPDYCLRLFNRKHANWSNDLVHEAVQVSSGKIITLKGDLLHDSCDSLKSYLNKQANYTDIQAQNLFKQKKPCKRTKLYFSPLFHFLKYYILKLGFLDGIPGFIHIVIGMQNSFNKYAKLYALYQEEQNEI